MSFIPGEGTEIASIASVSGSGISITNIADVDYIATNLVAGTNITLVPHPSNTSITINASAGGGGIASVSSGVGSGIEATTAGAGVNLTSALVAGTGIQLVPSSVNKNLTINNTQTITSAIGSGITASTVGGTTSLSANLVAGNGIQISLSGANTSKQINNIGVLRVDSANSGITVNQPAGNIVLTNNGVLGLTAGTGISITGTPANYTISATGTPAGGYGRNLQQVFSPGTNLWATGVNVFHTITNTMPSFYQVSGIVFNSAGTPYQGGTYPPASYTINWSCPVSTSSTPLSPGTNWYNGVQYTNPINPQYNLTINGRLVNRNYGSGTLNAVLDQAQCQASVITDTLTGIPYLSFTMTFVATASSPAGSGAGNDNNIGFEFSMAGFPASASYSFNPTGTVSAIEYCKVSASFTS